MEQAFHSWLRAHLPSDHRLLVPIGDDAAALDWAQDTACLVTTDLLADGVHFRTEEHSLEEIGRKALAVNLSDVAAMAGRPTAAFVSLLLPAGGGAEMATRIMNGMLPLADRHNTLIAGGDTNVWSGRLAIGITLLATAGPKGPLRRSTAIETDVVFVTGVLGGSLSGHHFRFEPRVELARYLFEHYDLHAGMDLSDGLAVDATRMASLSGCGIELYPHLLPLSDSALALAQADQSRSAVERALGDGEDFELLLTVSLTDAARLESEYAGSVPITRIGRCVPTPGLWLIDQAGQRTPCPALGYVHGQTTPPSAAANGSDG